MNAFLLELLFPTGWRRYGELHWRFADACTQADRLIERGEVRGVRVLPVKVSSRAVLERVLEAEEATSGR